MRAVALVACLVMLAACEAASVSRCGEVRRAAASAPDRRLLGVASEYPADTTLEARAVELSASVRARRRVAWDAIARVLAPVALTTPTALGEAQVPRFRTFYDRQDVDRIFQRLYGAMTPAARAARAPFAPGAVDEAFVFDTAFLDTLGTWSPSRWDAYVASFTTPEALASVGGVRRIATSPGLTRHLVESYPEILRCLEEGAPSEAPIAPRVDRLLRAEARLEGCDETEVGPFLVARGSTLRASLAVPDGVAQVAIVEGPSPRDATERCASTSRCEAEGPGVFTVRVASEAALDTMLEVERSTSAPPVACLRGALPLDAASVAAEWRRLEVDRPLPTYDTSAARLEALRAEDAPTWGEGEGEARPGPDVIYTQRLASGEVFALAGLHVRTGELPRGLYATLWWSDRPDEDFGADRPDAIRRLGGPWSNYKMCVVVEHAELDADPAGGFAEDAPSLAAALAAVHEGRGGPSWCSNPYIDAAPGLARGNCVGCHQHAMSGVRPGEIATDARRFPSSGRLAQRADLPADGFWGLDAGDALASVFADVVAYWQ